MNTTPELVTTDDKRAKTFLHLWDNASFRQAFEMLNKIENEERKKESLLEACSNNHGPINSAYRLDLLNFVTQQNGEFQNKFLYTSEAKRIATCGNGFKILGLIMKNRPTEQGNLFASLGSFLFFSKMPQTAHKTLMQIKSLSEPEQIKIFCGKDGEDNVRGAVYRDRDNFIKMLKKMKEPTRAQIMKQRGTVCALAEAGEIGIVLDTLEKNPAIQVETLSQDNTIKALAKDEKAAKRIFAMLQPKTNEDRVSILKANGAVFGLIAAGLEGELVRFIDGLPKKAGRDIVYYAGIQTKSASERSRAIVTLNRLGALVKEKNPQKPPFVIRSTASLTILAC